MVNALSIKGLNKSYNGLQALKNINLEIEKGDFFGYLGPNGAGKTTTIRSIVGLNNFDSGSIKVFGYDVIKDYQKTRGLIGLSRQDIAFDPFLNVRKILEFQAGYFGIGKKDAETRAEELLKAFDLKEKENARFRELSGGMKRRLTIAKALVHEPDLIILDEPTEGTDVELRRRLWNYFKKINNEGITILLTTHYIEEAEKLCNTIGIINKGEMIKVDSTENLLQNMSNQKIEITLNQKLDKIPDKLKKQIKCELKKNGNVLEVVCKNADVELSKVLNALNAQKIGVKHVEIVKDQLEDIYLKITGGVREEFDRV